MALKATEALTDPRVRDFLTVGRVARLATATPEGVPHNVPLCYWFDSRHFYFIVDQKPKKRTGRDLKRIRNIIQNPRVALLIDNYEEQWDQLAFVLVHGAARIVDAPDEYMLALRNLRDKYPQYRTMSLTPEANLMVRIEPETIHSWGIRFSFPAATS
jgi:PPOX class probable F420-dependent enzyme